MNSLKKKNVRSNLLKLNQQKHPFKIKKIISSKNNTPFFFFFNGIFFLVFTYEYNNIKFN